MTRTLINTLSAACIFTGTALAGVSEVIVRHWEDRYDQLQKQIEERKTLAKTGAACIPEPEVLNSQSLIRESDMTGRS